MDQLVIAIFAAVYAGMIFGRLPWVALDRAGIALIGAIAIVAATRTSPADAARTFDIPTLALLFSLMIVSAQFRLGGFYTWVAKRIGDARLGAPGLLAAVIAASGLLASLLTNDVIALALAPVLIEIASQRKLNPVPYLLGLAAGANVGSAATLVGNPQNILIGEALDLSFAGYLADSLLPSMLGLVVVWAVIAWLYRRRWVGAQPPVEVESPAFDARQTAKGAVVLVVVVSLFLAGIWPRDLIALGAAGFLLVNRTITSRRYLGYVDWQLLVLFAGLFVINDAFRATGALDSITTWAADSGADLHQPAWLFAAVSVLSNIVSNVPAVVLLLPFADHPVSGPGLALFSTLAGNLIVVSSIANIIVIDQAAKYGVRIGWREHARAGVPITAATLALAAAWLWVRSL
jgi:Na+/H+ antiporter NhaD/arsenite permease-like protein